jgi:hypothetical protein
MKYPSLQNCSQHGDVKHTSMRLRNVDSLSGVADFLKIIQIAQICIGQTSLVYLDVFVPVISIRLSFEFTLT